MKFFAKLAGVPNLERPVSCFGQWRGELDDWAGKVLLQYSTRGEDGKLLWPEARVEVYELKAEKVGEVRPQPPAPAMGTK